MEKFTTRTGNVLIYSYKFVDGDRMVNVTVRRIDDDRKRSHGRAHVSNWSDKLSGSDVLTPFAKALGLDNPYTRRGDHPAMDKAWDAFNSIIIDSKTADLKIVLSKVAEQLPMYKDAQLQFSRKAGCPCGCSPGFILKGVPGHYTIWVDLERGELAQSAVDPLAGTAVC